MDIGFIGLGRMGLNMVIRLRRGGHRVVAWDLPGYGESAPLDGPQTSGAAIRPSPALGRSGTDG